MAGRPRKPSHLKLVAGTARKSRANPAEPKPKPGAPVPPPHLNSVALAAWVKQTTLLGGVGVLSTLDAFALERMCRCYADMTAAYASLALPVEVIGADGETLEQVAAPGSLTYITHGKSGPMLRVRPELALIADLDRRLRGYLQDFGMTPAARSKVTAEMPDKDGALDSYFG